MPWFKVTAERFDWKPKNNVMYGYKRGDIVCQTHACVEYGKSINAVETVHAIKNAKLDKIGRVVRDINNAD